ncbi:hypothetical protein [Enterococcus sp. DIV0187]|uniref:hypothetical protein n=1 Tax=Enterococcus sp. DIV0187 TaxID=2774644 RepID=UPI003F684250
MMVILGIASAGLIIIALILTFLRLVFDLRFAAIQKESDQSPLFRRKVNYLRKLEQTRHIRYLLLTCLAIGIALMLFIGSFLLLTNDYQSMKKKTVHLEDRLERLEEQHKQLSASIPLKNYPAEGIGLKEYEWEKLTVEKKDSAFQHQVEAAISQKTSPYFGSSDTEVSLIVPKAITLHLKGQANDRGEKETIQKNIDAFAKEAEGVSELTDIHVRMIASIGKEKKIVYSVNYSRKNSEENFSKKSISEQNLKNDGGKG